MTSSIYILKVYDVSQWKKWFCSVLSVEAYIIKKCSKTRRFSKVSYIHSAINKFRDWPWKTSLKQDIWIFFDFCIQNIHLPVLLDLLQRFNSDLNACSRSFCGIASISRVVAVSMVEISLKSILSALISISGIERNRTGPNQMNMADDSTHRFDFESKIDEQWVRCDSVHYRAAETRSLDHDIRVEYDGFWPSDSSKLRNNMRQ